MHVTAIIVAAGFGKRMGGPTPKQFIPLMGQPLLARTLSPFEILHSIHEVLLIIPSEWKGYCHEEVIKKYHFKKITKCIPGGPERQDSVYLGLKEVSPTTELIVIHDGVRPLVTNSLIQASLETAAIWGAAVVAIPLADTLKQITSDGMVNTTLRRDGLWLAQTPQAFKKEIILKAHELAFGDRFYGTDDAALVERAGFPVKIVPGSSTNLKVTTSEDLRLAEFLLRERSS